MKDHGTHGMTSLDAALKELLDAVSATGQTESVDTLEGFGRVLAGDLVSPLTVPPFANSAMDGYAVRAREITAQDVATRKLYQVSQRIPAGSAGGPLENGTVARIFTGAPIPEGADAVLPQELAVVSEDGTVAFTAVPAIGDSVRRAGEDIAAGQVVVASGTRLDAAALGLIASVGIPTVQVFRRPRVAVFFTGDELTMPGEPLHPGAIYNSNRFVLRALLKGLDCTVTDLGIVRDSEAATRAALVSAAQDNDLIITSGGVSVGEEDHVKHAVEGEGRLTLWKLSIKPGKPLAFGSIRRDGESHAWFLGLPGNPVATFVTFELLVRPFLLKLAGQNRHLPRVAKLRADFEWLRPAAMRREFLRARRNETGGVTIYPNQSSGVLTSVAWADGLVDVAPGQVIRRGDDVSFLPFEELDS